MRMLNELLLQPEAKTLGRPKSQLNEMDMNVRFIIPLLKPISLSIGTQPNEAQAGEKIGSRLKSCLAAKALVKQQEHEV